MTSCSDTFASLYGASSAVLSGGESLSLRMHPSSFTSALSHSLTNHRDKGREGKQGMNLHVGGFQDYMLRRVFCGNTRILFLLCSSISPLRLAVLSSGAGIAENKHS